MQAERLTRQIPTQPNNNGINPPDNIQVNGPVRPKPNKPLVIPHEIPQSNFVQLHFGRRIIQTPMRPIQHTGCSMAFTEFGQPEYDAIPL